MGYTVYKHTSPNGKVYIGITGRSTDIRWNKGNGYHNNKHFYSAITKYGWDNFQHEILYEGLSKEEAETKEQILIKKFNSNNPKYGYNIASGGNSSTGYHHSEEKKKENC